MSVVAWNGKFLAADRQQSVSGMRSRCSKMLAIDELNVVCAWVGKHEHGLILADWFRRGRLLSEWPKFQATDDWTRLIVVDGHDLVTYEQQPVAQLQEAPFIAFGSGRDYAMGAMAAGFGPEAAVMVASQFDIDCGMGVESIDLSQMRGLRG